MEYVEQDLVKIAKRENNTKRNYLVVNPLQAKHIPVSPMKALELFNQLAEIFRNKYDISKTLVVGFAETATAIGAQVAVSLGTKYIQTTREIIPGVEYLFFSEEHSHATEQKLVKNDIDLIIPDIDRIIFVEDEVTTGKTILNIISVLEKKYSKKINFSVASLLNGMTEEFLEIYKSKNIDLFYLVKTDHSNYAEIADILQVDGNYYISNEDDINVYSEIKLPGTVNARRIVLGEHYRESCEKLFGEIINVLGNIEHQNILVVGTEEFMYPALYVGKRMEDLGNNVLCHSTTRSPICVSLNNDYPLHNRYQLKSLYDDDRKTFLYDIKEYDKVLIITDAIETESKGTKTLISALSEKNKHIVVFRWC